MSVDRNDVVIAGAGPNGLMLACELALAGIKPVVLDVLLGPTVEPKANGLVGQVIRQLDMRGLYATFSGDDRPPQPSPGWIFAGMTLSFAELEPNPMFALRLPQPELVSLLVRQANRLGVEIRWNHQLVDFTTLPDGVLLAVESGERSIEMQADYLVGADGGRSVVRKRAGIDFPGVTTPTVGRMAHVSLPGLDPALGGYDVPGFGRLPFGHNRLDTGTVIIFPFETGRQMLGAVEYGRAGDDMSEPMTLAELGASLRRVLGVDLPFDTPPGPGPHALRRMDGQNTRQAERYRAGRVLLLGDAAHVHSPMGGPGLNLGLQDAVNLGWKLAADINGWAPAGLLDTYESERYPVGERVIMQSLSQIALMSPGPEIGALRKLFAEIVAKPGVSDDMAHLLAGSDVRYDVGDQHPLSGRLVPDLVLDDGRRVANLLHAGRPVLLDLCEIATACAQPWAARVDCVNGHLAAGPAAILIRPDGYVAWAADTFDADAQERLEASLQRWFGQP